MKLLKKITVYVLMTALSIVYFTGVFDTISVDAATKPGKPKITVKVNDDAKSITIKIAKTKNTEGYRIMMKAPGAKKFTKLTTVKKDGTAKRSYTVKKLDTGSYSFKVRAYKKSGKKTVWGSYSNTVNVSISEETSKVSLEPEISAVLEQNYPKLKELAENGKVGITADIKTDDKEYITLGKWKYERRKWFFNETEMCDMYNIETDNEATPIEWQVLDYSEDGKKALVISRYILGHLAYDDEWGEVTWETCSSRKWLNNDFYNKAFSEEEKNLIELTHLTTGDNPETGMSGGNDTDDRIFFLSIEEATKYYPVIEGKFEVYDYCCTDIDGQVTSWYLRCAGANMEMISCYQGDGFLNLWGIGTGQQEFFLRPACWITLTPEIIAENNLSLGESGQEKKRDLNKDDIYVTIGNWSIPKGEKENAPLEWKILDYDEKNNKVLLLSRYAVRRYYFDESQKNADTQNMDVLWENSYVRKWLNDSFFNSAFSESEKKQILLSTLKNKGDKYYNKKDGEKTKDNVFLLSMEEAEKYFDHARGDWAYNRILEDPDGEISLWFLRSPGNLTNIAASINEMGSADREPGDSISVAGYRPAIWISLK